LPIVSAQGRRFGGGGSLRKTSMGGGLEKAMQNLEL
jgi:hypothetical protein